MKSRSVAGFMPLFLLVGSTSSVLADPLHDAVLRLDPVGIAAHLDLEAVNTRCNGRTPLHVLADYGEAAPELDARLTLLAQTLIDAGAQVNLLDAEGRTALDHAVMRGHRSLAALLRQHGAVHGGLDLQVLQPVGYPSYAEFEAMMLAAEQDFPAIAERHLIGTTGQGRSMWALKLTDNPSMEEDEPEFKFIGTMHGNEVIGMAMCLNLIDHLTVNYGVDPHVTSLVDELEIWIVPCMNPDGYVNNSRFNASGVDLNRSFPDPYSSPNNTTAGRPPETAAIMQWSWDHRFTLSANLHSGTIVVNYPLDNNPQGLSVYTASPDDDLFIWISEEYARHNLPMWNSTAFYHGITNGAAWYAIDGGMQDWSYIYDGCNEVTIELSNSHNVAWSQVPTYWANNRESMLSYMATALVGIRGIVTDSFTGAPLAASLTVIGRDHAIFTDSDVGDYHRMLLPGTYDLRFEADGYEPLEVHSVAVSLGQATRLDVQLSAPDCQTNGVPDDIDILGATSFDCNNNGQPDECDVDPGPSSDCNLDGIPDECQLADDCDANGVPDDCQPDCDADGIPDVCDLDVIVLFEDTFETDLGWTVISLPGTAGVWERAIPQEVLLGGDVMQPDHDSDDPGDHCFVTDGAGGSPDEHDVDGGPTELISPLITVTAGSATLDYAYWFYSDEPGDALVVFYALDGGPWTYLKKHHLSESAWRSHVAMLPGPATIQLKFLIQDVGSGSLTEALVDHVRLQVPDCGAATWQNCLRGPVVPALASCVDLDEDGDGDIDLQDFAVFSAGW